MLQKLAKHSFAFHANGILHAPKQEESFLTFWNPVFLKSVQPASFFFFRIWFFIFAFSYSLLKVLTMMGIGREMMRTPTMAQHDPTILPNQVFGVMSP